MSAENWMPRLRCGSYVNLLKHKDYLIYCPVVYLHSLNGGVLVTNNGRTAFLSANHCQGQLQTPQ